MGYGQAHGRTRLSIGGGANALLALVLCGASLACNDGASIVAPGAALGYAPTGDSGSEGAAADPVVAAHAAPAPGSTPGSTAATPQDDRPVIEPEPPGGPAETDPAAPAPPLRGGVALADEALARQALGLLGSGVVGAAGSCSSCHSLGRPTLSRWLQLTRSFSEACLSSPELSDAAAADAMLRCFDQHATPVAELAPTTFGIYAAAAHLPWFSFVFEHAAPGAARHDDFITRVAMPRSGSAWTQEQFDVVAEWFARGLPYSLELVPEDSGGACSDGVDPRLPAHVAAMRESGWRARNEQVPILMFGCDGGEPASCLGQFPLARDAYGQDWDTDAARIRILKDNGDAPSNYWSRCSADGRFIASGLRGAGLDYHGQFVDLDGPRTLLADFSYDPTFFPDNSGFLVQRAGYASSPAGGVPSYRQVAIACNQSVLTGSDDLVSGGEPECDEVDAQIGLYQQVGKSLDGDDHWVVFGSFVDDNGGISPTLSNPSAAFDSRSAVSFTPLINRGSSFEPGAATRVATPLAGDPMLSPSGRLLVTRLKGLERSVVVDGQRVTQAEQSGYALMLVATQLGPAGPTVTLSEVGRVCVQGGKPALSYDERWMVLHHYVTDEDATSLGFSGPDDPGFAGFRERGAANLLLIDLLDGSTRTITRMGAGQYAVFPHFRSDGWIYFVIRTLEGEEYFAASDAAVLLEAEGEPAAAPSLRQKY